MRNPDDVRGLRVAPEALARWSLETRLEQQTATYRTLAFLARTEHAAATLLPVLQLLIEEKPALDADGFLRLPRTPIEHFDARARRAAAWMDQLVFFREKFPRACDEAPPAALFSLARAFTLHEDSLEAAVDLLIRECVLPELEELIQRALPYPPLQQVLMRLREGEAQRSGQARKLASQLLGELSGSRIWRVRKRLAASAGRAILGARPLVDELERAGLPADRARAAKGFGRRLEEAISELSGARVLPAVLVNRLANALGKKSDEADAEIAAAQGEADEEAPLHVPDAAENQAARDNS
jgi:hypothetical protein